MQQDEAMEKYLEKAAKILRDQGLSDVDPEQAEIEAVYAKCMNGSGSIDIEPNNPFEPSFPTDASNHPFPSTNNKVPNS